MTLRTVATHLGIGVAGLLVGRLTAPPAAVAEAAPAAATTKRLVCTNVAAAPAPSACPEADARLQWCEGRLAAATRVKPTGRSDWPETTPAEAPDAWTETVEALVRACDLPVRIEVTDCDEYPCVAAARPTREGLGRKAILDAVHACPAATELLGPLDFDAVTTSVHCPDGRREPAFTLFATATLDASNPAVAALLGDKEPELEDVIVWGGRRVESALQLWSCE